MEAINPANIQRFSSMVEHASRIAIVTHTKPDGDAIGSSAAMYHFLKHAGKHDVILVLPDPYPSTLSFLTEGIPPKDILIFSSEPVEASSGIASRDMIICLDFNSFSRAGEMNGILTASQAVKVLIDHHLNPKTEDFSLVFSETEISSASEFLYHILMEMPHISHKVSRIPRAAAEALMTGMTTDTNNFANSTYPSTLRMAADLIESGVDRDRIVDRVNCSYCENRIRLLGYVLKDNMRITEDGVAYIVLDRDMLEKYEVKDGDTEGFVNMPLSIGDIKMSILAKEDMDFMRISVRSKKGISANRMATRYFHGGGHENAAGGRLYIPQDISSAEECAEYIRTVIREYFNESNE